MNTKKMFQDFQEKNLNEDARKNESYAKLYEDMKKYNEKLIANYQDGLEDPYSFEDPAIRLEDYGIEDGIAGYIDIPAMEIELPLYLGANEKNMTKGAAQLTETSMPIGGNSTNMVIAAHRGYSYAKMFRDIEKIQVGDDIFITNLWEKMVYEVEGIEIISPDEVNKIKIQENRDMVTLITCHPYPYDYQRYVVYCVRVS